MRMKRGKKMKVTVGISNRHLHLTEEDYKILCGDEPIEQVRPINQPGQYASNTFLKLKTDKSEIDRVRLLGPLRSYTQVEISRTDAYQLGLDPPLRESGDVEGAAPITIIGPCGTITRNCAILATRHIHIDHAKREELGLLNVDKVQVKVPGIKGGILDNVSIKETNPAYFEMHLDTDDANSHLLKNNDEVEIIVNEK